MNPIISKSDAALEKRLVRWMARICGSKSWGKVVIIIERGQRREKVGGGSIIPVIRLLVSIWLHLYFKISQKQVSHMRQVIHHRRVEHHY